MKIFQRKLASSNESQRYTGQAQLISVLNDVELNHVAAAGTCSDYAKDIDHIQAGNANRQS